MCPLQRRRLSILAFNPMRKWFQEERSRTASSRPAAGLTPSIVTSAKRKGNLKHKTHILEVCVGRVDLGAKVLVERHAPEPVVLCLACYAELVPKGVVSLHSLFLSICAAFMQKRLTAKTPEKTEPRATSMALRDKDQVVFEHQSSMIAYPVRVATSMRVWGLYSVDV